MDTLNYQGQDLPFVFNMNAIMKFLKSEKITLTELDAILTKLEPQKVIKMSQFALAEGARMNGDKFDLTLEQVGEMISFKNFEAVVKMLFGELPDLKN